MDRAEKAALKIHDAARQEGNTYALQHAHTLLEEVSYGRGFKSGYIRGAVDTEKELIELAMLWRDSGEVNVKSFSAFLSERT